jgi:hypothetical protein
MTLREIGWIIKPDEIACSYRFRDDLVKQTFSVNPRRVPDHSGAPRNGVKIIEIHYLSFNVGSRYE